MSKVYFALHLLNQSIKSVILTIIFRIFGCKIGKKNKFYSKPIIRGYLNKITIGNRCYFDDKVKIVINKEGNLDIGNNTLFSSNVNINAGVGNIKIGSNIMVAANSYIINGDHNYSDELSVRNSNHVTKDILIEDNVWIGANCLILKGVTIGEGAIIGAGSVVIKDIPPYSVCVGSPCKFIKNRFKGDILIKKLKENGYSQEMIDKIINRMNG